MMKVKVKPYHVLFSFTTVVGLAYFLSILTLTIHGPPTSTNSIVMYNAGWPNSLIASISPFIALFMLFKEADSKLMSILVWISFVVGVALSLVTLTRGATWLASNETEKSQEVKDFTYLKDKKERQPSQYAIYISRREKCCGVNSFHDWIEIYKEVDDADKATASITRPRKLPDFCCNENKDLTHGCGNRAIDSLRETLRDAKSNCSEDRPGYTASRTRCLGYYKSLNLADPSKLKNGSSDPEKKSVYNQTIGMSVAGPNNTRLVWVKDVRINPAKDRESLKSLPEVETIISRSCKKADDKQKKDNTKKESKQSIFVLYGGKMRSFSGTNTASLNVFSDFTGGDTPVKLTPCEPKDADLPACFYKIVPLLHFSNEYSFCQWLSAKVTATGIEEIKLDGEVAAGIVENDGKIYTKGCGAFVINYIDNFVIASFVFSIILLIMYFVDMITFTHNYLTYVEAHLRVQPMPRWYEPLPNENPPMHAYGDVGFIPDVGCPSLPLPPVRPRMELVNKTT